MSLGEAVAGLGVSSEVAVLVRCAYPLDLCLLGVDAHSQRAPAGAALVDTGCADSFLAKRARRKRVEGQEPRGEGQGGFLGGEGGAQWIEGTEGTEGAVSQPKGPKPRPDWWPRFWPPRQHLFLPGNSICDFDVEADAKSEGGRSSPLIFLFPRQF